MKRCTALLLLTITLLLTACGRAAPEEPATTAHSTTIPTSETTTQTTAPLPKPEPVPVIDEVAWKVIETDAAMQERMQGWPGEDLFGDAPKELVLSDTKTVIQTQEESGGTITRKLVLRENGSETLLWEAEDHLGSDRAKSPILSCAMDERYVLVAWQGWEWMAGHSIFDTRETKEIPLSVPTTFLGYIDGYLYFTASGGEEIDQLTLIRAKWSRGKLQTEDLLAGVPGTEMPDGALMRAGLLSPDGRYFTTESAVFDLQQRKCVFQLDETRDSFDFPHFEDAHTLYFYTSNARGHRFALEITLP